MSQEPERKQSAKDTVRHPLLVYMNLGRRYRTPGLLLMIAGAALFLPLFVKDLRNEYVEPEVVASVGTVIFLVGMGFWFFAWMALNRAYVQCAKDVLTVRTPFYLSRISYRRIKSVQPVRVSQVFPKEELRGMGKALMTPLLGSTAVELHVTSWPAPKGRMKRLMGEFVFSKRAEAWVFIVPNYSILMRQLDTALQNKADERRGVRTSYRDPFERYQDYVSH